MFYGSLAALLGLEVSVGWKWLTGLWMVLALLSRDTLADTAWTMSAVGRRLAGALPGLAWASGAALAVYTATG